MREGTRSICSSICTCSDGDSKHQPQSRSSTGRRLRAPLCTLTPARPVSLLRPLPPSSFFLSPFPMLPLRRRHPPLLPPLHRRSPLLLRCLSFPACRCGSLSPCTLLSPPPPTHVSFRTSHDRSCSFALDACGSGVLPQIQRQHSAAAAQCRTTPQEPPVRRPASSSRARAYLARGRRIEFDRARVAGTPSQDYSFFSLSMPLHGMANRPFATFDRAWCYRPPHFI